MLLLLSRLLLLVFLSLLFLFSIWSVCFLYFSRWYYHSCMRVNSSVVVVPDLYSVCLISIRLDESFYISYFKFFFFVSY